MSGRTCRACYRCSLACLLRNDCVHKRLQACVSPAIHYISPYVRAHPCHPNPGIDPQAPVVNVVAATLVVISVIPIYIAQRYSNTDERGAGLL